MTSGVVTGGVVVGRSVVTRTSSGLIGGSVPTIVSKKVVGSGVEVGRSVVTTKLSSSLYPIASRIS
jgi:hypothetical protein